MPEHDLSTEKYLRAQEDARELRRQEDAAAAESEQAESPAQSSYSMHRVLSRFLPLALVIVTAGWLYNHRASFGVLTEPVGTERSTNALLWMSGADYEYADTKLGRLSGHGPASQVEMPEFEPILSGDELFPGMMNGDRGHDNWYEGLPGE